MLDKSLVTYIALDTTLLTLKDFTRCHALSSTLLLFWSATSLHVWGSRDASDDWKLDPEALVMADNPHPTDHFQYGMKELWCATKYNIKDTVAKKRRFFLPCSHNHRPPLRQC
jgi:hypothetical protein